MILLALLTGCPKNNETPDGGEPCSGFVGDMSQAPEVQLVARTLDGTVAVPSEGDMVPLILPPQGGRILLIGVRARNLDTCGAQLTGALRDQCTNRVLGLEGRPVELQTDTNGDGWASPSVPMQFNNFANIAVCPNQVSGRNIDGEPYQIEVSITDREGRMAQAALDLVPECAEPAVALDCRCLCATGYILGQPCVDPPDAGAPPGTCPTLDAGTGP